jgi:hypothetical protein
MSPPPAATNGAPRRSQGARPHESRQSGDGPADPVDSQRPETPRGTHVVLLQGCEGRRRDRKRRPGRRGRVLWRGESQGGSEVGPHGPASGFVARRKPCRRARSLVRFGGGGIAGTSGGQRSREGRRRDAVRPRRVKPMGAPALRAPGGTVVQAAMGVTKPRTWHGAARESPPTRNGTAVSRPCRRARKLRRGCIGRRPPGSGRPVRGCRDRPLKGRESAGGTRAASAVRGPVEREPAGRRNAARVGRNP